MNQTIFIGRKLTDSAKIVLKNNNISFEDRELIEIKLITPDISFFQTITEKRKNWVITSSWAAKWLKIHHSEIGFSDADSVFCLSAKQAEILKEISSRIFISEQQNAKSIAELVTQKNNDEAIIYLSGNKSLKVLENELHSKEFSFCKSVVYRNTPVIQKINSEFKAYLFFSPSGIESFIETGNLIPGSAVVFTIGKTTGSAAKKYFPNPVLESPVQEEVGFIEFALDKLKSKRKEISNTYL